MKFEHKLNLNVDEAIESLRKSLSGNNNNANDEKEKDDIDYKEFRFRVKNKYGTDINIPGSFIGLCFGLIATKVIFDIIHEIVKDHKE